MKILGLDLGIGSVGWCLIEIDEENHPLLSHAIGSRILSISPTESDNFCKGKGETVCSQRTFMRTARKGLDRYQMRRKILSLELAKLGMISSDNSLLTLSPLQTWQLRADAATTGKRLSLAEIGRVLLMLNQRRGYRHSKSDDSDSSQKSYVTDVNQRYSDLNGMTPGQFFATKLKESETTSSAGKNVYDYRIKGYVLPRKAYEEEFYRIMEVQGEFYPEILNDATVKKLHDIIFYQRPLKSCKRLVSVCEFESLKFINKTNGKEVITGPKVAPRTSPIAQETRLWETVNNIRLKNFSNKKRVRKDSQPGLFDEEMSQSKDFRLLQYEYIPNQEERTRIFNFLNTNEKLTQTQLLKILGLKASDGFRWEGAPKNGLEGNRTYTQLKEALGDLAESMPDILRFNIEYENTDIVDQDTGEIISRVKMNRRNSATGKNDGEIYPQYQDEPLYRLWHTVYSSSSKEELSKAIEKQFGITDKEVIDRLYKIDFVKPGYSNRSAKFMRKLLPYLKDGYLYSEACTFVGVNHSDSLTKEENERRVLKKHIDNIEKGELRQPVVEKILNQMINIVNALIEKYGEIDEIRVELARELKQSKDQRAETTSNIAKRERENAAIAIKIKEQGLVASRRNIQKYRLWEESGHRCIYCGKTLSLGEFLGGHGGEIEHIVPRSILFDDSMTNKACSCSHCNKEKNNRTAYDYMSGKSEADFNRYVANIDTLLKEKKISRTKHDRFMMSQSEIPQDFLDRDLRQSQYIAKKAREILFEVCRNVYATSGSVTDFLRHTWGYDNILHNLNIKRYEQADLVEEVSYEHEGQTHKELRIKDWSKRLDHRHHAVDALVIALTRQGYIQRLSNLNTQRDKMYADIQGQSNEFKEKFHLLEKWAELLPHFPVNIAADTIDSIAVSIKSGKKLSTPGKRYIYRNGKRKLVQDNILVPRGALHQETVFGKIKLQDNGKDLKYAFSNPELIADDDIRNLVINRIQEADGDFKKALKALKRSPLIIAKNGKEKEITSIDCYKETFVTRADLSALTAPGIQRIVDKSIREAALDRLAECKNDIKKYQQSFEENPIYIGNDVRHPVKRVRIFSNDNLVPIRKDSTGKAVAFASSGNNHHVAFYEKDGKVTEVIVSAWTGMKRKLIGLPVIIKDPDEAWTRLIDMRESDDVREVADTLPPVGSRFLYSLKIGDMCLLGLTPEQLSDALDMNDMKTLTAHLYRVQTLSTGDYRFRLHTWTNVDAKNARPDTEMKALYRIRSYNAITLSNLIPVSVDNLGQIKILK